MASLVRLDLSGERELVRRFRQLEAKLGKKIARKALRAGAKPIQRKAKQLAPVDTGNLKRNIKIRAVRRSRKRFGVVVRTGRREEMAIPQSRRGYYPAVQEFGSKKRNVPARFFMKEALEAERERATKIIADALAQGIEEEGRR